MDYHKRSLQGDCRPGFNHACFAAEICSGGVTWCIWEWVGRPGSLESTWWQWSREQRLQDTCESPSKISKISKIRKISDISKIGERRGGGVRTRVHLLPLMSPHPPTLYSIDSLCALYSLHLPCSLCLLSAIPHALLSLLTLLTDCRCAHIHVTRR